MWGRQYIPIHPTLFDDCRMRFHRDEITFHLAEIYLTLWASAGLQTIRQDVAPYWLNRLRQQWSMREFQSKEEQEITLMAFSLSREIRVIRDGNRIKPGGNGGVKARVESIVPHSGYLTFWKVKLCYPDRAFFVEEYTERLDLVLEIISEYC